MAPMATRRCPPNIRGWPVNRNDYLEKALRDYKSNKRKNPLMGPQATEPVQAGQEGSGGVFLRLKRRSQVKY